MGSDLLTYIQWLQLMAFFSGYPLVYAIVQVITAGKKENKNVLAEKFTSSLPFAYALTGTLFIGLLLKDLYPNYSFNHITDQFQDLYLTGWGLLSVLFWIPVFSKNPILSLLHSLIFFSLLLKDLFMFMSSSIEKEMIQNDMKIYTMSLLINAGTLLCIVLASYILQKISRKKQHLI